MPFAFIFDPAKSAANLAKHGIDFVQAQAVWADPDRVDGPGVSTTEPRRLMIGRIGGKVWACVYTYREEAIRIISCRRARPRERDSYSHHR
jgi:uncharacterized protein